MDILSGLLSMLTGEPGRVLLTLVGGWLLRRSPVSNKAIPVIAMVGNILVALASGLIGGEGIGVEGVVSGTTTGALAIGVHSAMKNTAQIIK